ncbi:MAG TPA: type II secretion system F family protein [Roseomonas sp.]|jgi:tight adherence protein C
MAQQIPLLLFLLAALLSGVGAAVLLLHSAEERDLTLRMRGVLRPAERAGTDGGRQGRRGGLQLLGAPFRLLGEMLRGYAILPQKDMAELEQIVATAGFDGRRAVPTFIGVKVAMLVLCPLAAWAFCSLGGYTTQTAIMAVAVAAPVGMMAPNRAMGMMRDRFHAALRKGLPDALDLLVVCAEAGLALDSAIERVARELAPSNAALGLEFTILAQELRMLPDRDAALQRMGERTGVEGFRRLASTLAQTRRYGTPLAQALRVLAGEMRQERMLRIEEKAVRLPTLLVLPLILFIMPALFIALIGPSILDLAASL